MTRWRMHVTVLFAFVASHFSDINLVRDSYVVPVQGPEYAERAFTIKGVELNITVL